MTNEAPRPFRFILEGEISANPIDLMTKGLELGAQIGTPGGLKQDRDEADLLAEERWARLVSATPEIALRHVLQEALNLGLQAVLSDARIAVMTAHVASGSIDGGSKPSSDVGD
jgi:hypothetical protein